MPPAPEVRDRHSKIGTVEILRQPDAEAQAQPQRHVGVAGKIEDLNRKLKRWGDDRRDVVVHLASCVVSDNYHRPPCPHRDYIKTIVERKGYPVIFGSYISKTAEKKRQDGIYEAF